jgi:hypothetical protein
MTRPLLRLSPSLLLLAASLAACTSAKDIEARNEARCQARGLEPNTKNYEDCMRQVDAERSARMEQRRREQVETPYVPPLNRGY